MNSFNRRSFLSTVSLGTLAYTTPGVFAELAQTPRQTEGPFYPNKLPLDTDNDLIIVNDSLTPAVGQITHLSGTVRDIKGDPANAKDGVLRRIQDPKQRDSVIINFSPIKGSKIDELQARFDIVLGFTPKDQH